MSDGGPAPAAGGEAGVDGGSDDGVDGGNEGGVSTRTGGRPRARRVLRRIGSAVFGDRVGLALFLGAVVVFSLYWRVGVFINDNYTVLNGLAALAEGHVAVEEAVVGPHLGTPGMHAVDGVVLARNYGQIVTMLPFRWALAAAGAVANLRAVLVALWHLALFAFFLQVGRLAGRRRLAALGGGAVVLASFFANVALLERLPEAGALLAGAQLHTVVVGALCGVVFYRLVARQVSRPTGVAAGAALSLATPVAFWAVVPKRHVLSTLLLVGVVYAFARSREPEGGARALPGIGEVPAFRALSYGLVGLYAWVHAAEALFVLVPLVVADLATAPRTDRRALGFVAGVFALSLVPFLVTNGVLSGQVLKPPRMLPNLDPSDLAGGGSVAGTDGDPLSDFGSGSGGTSTPVLVASQILDQYRLGLSTLGSEPGRLVEVFVQGPVVGREDLTFRGVNLAMLEAAPLLGALGAIAGLRVRSLHRRLKGGLSTPDPTTLLVTLLVASLALLYLPRLPLRVQITVRYLVPVVVLLGYLLAVAAPIDRVVAGQTRVAGLSFAGGVLAGVPALAALVSGRGLGIAEAVQLHGLVGLVAALGVLLGIAAAGLDDRFDPVAAVSLGLAAAAGTAFVVLTGLGYFSFVGPYLLPVVDLLTGLFPLS